MANNAIFRIRLISGAFVMGALAIVVRLFFVQIIHGDEYRQQAERQYTSTAGSAFNRGNIYFVNKEGNEVAAASLAHGYALAIHPAQIPVGERERVYRGLNKEIAIDKSNFLMRAAKVSDPYEEIAQQVPSAVAERIQALSLPGVVLKVVR